MTRSGESRNGAIALLVAGGLTLFLTACATSGRVRPDFTQMAVLSLQVGMTREEVTALFGRPDRSQVTTCGSDTARPWQCMIWEYDLPPHERGEYQLIENTNRLYLSTDGLLNSWSADLMWEDPVFVPAATACVGGADALGAATPDEAVGCFLSALASGNAATISRLASPAGTVSSTPEVVASQSRHLLCRLTIGEAMCTPTVVARIGSPIPNNFRFASVAEDRSRVRYHVITDTENLVSPLEVIRDHTGRWFVVME